MVDVSHKTPVKREALAEGRIKVGGEILAAIQDASIAKGDIVCVAKVAAILGAKQTANIIPMCHQLELSNVDVCISADESKGDLIVQVTAKTIKHATGVEMEALVGASVALLTIYDMCKSINNKMLIYDIKLLLKKKNGN